jgi:hypothetical protein
MAKRKRKAKKSRRPVPAAASVGEKLRAALRSIIRDWQTMREPLPVDEITDRLPNDPQRFRIRGAESYEELQERVLKFAGRVWQLKDGLIKWLETRPSLKIDYVDPSTGTAVGASTGQNAEQIIEGAAKLCLPLLLCADLYNSHKHYDDCNRSGYQPFLNGVQFDGSAAGELGIRYDGKRKIGEIAVTNRLPVPFRIEIHSQNQPVNFGDAVITVGRAFKYWIPLIRQMELLSLGAGEDKAILEDLAVIEDTVKNASPFKPNDATIGLGTVT